MRIAATVIALFFQDFRTNYVIIIFSKLIEVLVPVKFSLGDVIFLKLIRRIVFVLPNADVIHPTDWPIKLFELHICNLAACVPHLSIYKMIYLNKNYLPFIPTFNSILNYDSIMSFLLVYLSHMIIP